MKRKKPIIILGIIFLLIVFLVFGNKDILRFGQKNSPVPSLAPSKSGFSIIIEEQNFSGQNGIVTFEPLDSQTIVKIKSIGYPEEISQPAHIHLGTCGTPGEIKYPLVSLKNGESETTISIDIENFRKSSLILNLHKSNEEINTYVSCGAVKSQ